MWWWKGGGWHVAWLPPLRYKKRRCVESSMFVWMHVFECVWKSQPSKISGAMGKVDVTFILQVDRFGSLFVSWGFPNRFFKHRVMFRFQGSLEFRSSQFWASSKCLLCSHVYNWLSSDLSLHSYEFPLQLGGLVGASFYVSNLAPALLPAKCTPIHVLQQQQLMMWDFLHFWRNMTTGSRFWQLLAQLYMPMMISRTTPRINWHQDCVRNWIWPMALCVK